MLAEVMSGSTSLSLPMTQGPKLSPMSQFKSMDKAIPASPPKQSSSYVIQTMNDSPQPQLAFSLGFTNLNPSLSPSRTKSTSVPSIYCMLSGSTNSLTPCCSKSRSSGRASSTYSIL